MHKGVVMIRKGDFVELDYTARLAEDGAVFDTTEVEEAKKAGMLHDHEGHDHSHGDEEHGQGHLHREDLKPVIVCVGEKQILPGLDAKLEGLALGAHKITLGEDDAFGRKDAKKLRLMPIKLFKDQEIRPFVGLVLDVDGTRGVVRSISGGRVIVDFNHPLAGKKVEYSINIRRVVADRKEQLESVLRMLRFPYSSIEVKEQDAEVRIKLELPAEVLKTLEEDLSRQTGLKVRFISEAKKEKEEGKEEKGKEKGEEDKVENKEQKTGEAPGKDES
jgi:FKBP-type peptidyl-prolyl cis-trans isomerase 2